MKDNLENAFKDSLDNLELPYDSAAWTAMSSKLDAIQPTASTPPASTVGKWIIAAGAVITVSVGAYLYVNRDKEVAQTQVITENPVNAEKSVENKQTESTKITENSANHTTNELVETDKKQTNTDIENVNTAVNKGTSTSPSSTPLTTETTYTPKATNGTTTSTAQPESIITPIVKDVCENELTSIKNSNSVDLVLVTPSKDRLIIKKNTTFKSDVLSSGNYRIVANDKVISTFTVHAAPKVDFTIDNQNPFEEGLPSMPVETFSEGVKFTWTFDNSRNTVQGKTANAHFFTKGEHSITLTVQNDAGCKAETTKNVEISSDYNLFAPNAFEPNHPDVRRTKFIPNALLVRDVNFTMIIVNPKSGVTMFSTSNPIDGWDGVDKSTGELVGENETYVWKVFLKNALPNEKSEYSGTVIRK